MNLGIIVRRRRKEKKLTLKQVAEKAGVSEGFMSQVENNVKSPSVDTLINICRALEADIGELLQPLQDPLNLHIIKSAEWGDIDVPHTGFATRRFLPPDERTVIDSAIIILEPGRSIPVRKEIKNGQEVLCVLRGTLELVHGDRTETLEAGDAAHYWSYTQRQSIRNLGEETAVVMWVGTC